MQKRVQRCTATREKYQTKPENGGIDYAQNRGIDSNIVLVLIWLWFLASGLSFRPGGGISNIYDTFRLVESPLELDWRIVDERPKQGDRKSTRLNSSHLGISYAVFCLK